MPSLKREFSVGDVVAVIGILFTMLGGAMSYARMDERVSSMDKHGTTVERQSRDEQQKLREAMASLSARLEATNKNLDRLLDK